MKLNTIIKPIRKFILDNSSQILTGLEITGYITAGVMMIPATQKATKAIEEKEYDERRELTRSEKIKIAAPYYIPAGIVAAGATGAAIGRLVKDQRKQAALATACSIAETSYKDLKEKTKEIVGEETYKQIEEKVVEEKITQAVDESSVEITGFGNDLFYEYESGRIYRCSKDIVMNAVGPLNEKLYSYNEVDLNEYYAAIGLGGTGFGNTHEWSSEDGSIRINIDEAKLLSNGLVAYQVDFDNRLRAKVRRRW